MLCRSHVHRAEHWQAPESWGVQLTAGLLLDCTCSPSGASVNVCNTRVPHHHSTRDHSDSQGVSHWLIAVHVFCLYCTVPWQYIFCCRAETDRIHHRGRICASTLSFTLRINQHRLCFGENRTATGLFMAHYCCGSQRAILQRRLVPLGPHQCMPLASILQYVHVGVPSWWV